MSAIATASRYWLVANAEPIGLGLIVDDPGRAKTQLYAARKKLLPQLPTLDNFTIRTSPINPAFEIWLLRTSPQELDLDDLTPEGEDPDA